MKAVVLVGGEGTRLRPITETIPKPLVPLMDRASLDHVLDHLARHGVHEVVLSSSYLEEPFRAFVQGRHGDPAITWITETEPLGTGGAIVNALADLGGDEAFLALNGDILTDLDLTAMVAMHRERGAAATIALTHVDDARPFGLVPTEPDGRVTEFREKPAEPVPGDINAGTYVLEASALEGWPRGENASIERDIFPRLISEGRPVYGFVSDACHGKCSVALARRPEIHKENALCQGTPSRPETASGNAFRRRPADSRPRRPSPSRSSIPLLTERR